QRSGRAPLLRPNRPLRLARGLAGVLRGNPRRSWPHGASRCHRRLSDRRTRRAGTPQGRPAAGPGATTRRAARAVYHRRARPLNSAARARSPTSHTHRKEREAMKTHVRQLGRLVTLALMLVASTARESVAGETFYYTPSAVYI